ncbi:aconitase family protein [Shigella flexneri]
MDCAAHQDGQGSADRRGLLHLLRPGRCPHRDPGCSLCMGNQARVAEGASVVSTSTRNFPNRLGKGAKRLIWLLPSWRLLRR